MGYRLTQRYAFITVILMMGFLCCEMKVSPNNTKPICVIENEFVKVQINHNGAELQSIFDKQVKREILWIGDSTFWKRRSPVMFPVNVRIFRDTFAYDGKEYRMPPMGLAIDAPFELQASDQKSSAIFNFKSLENTKQYYPFDFNFSVIYELEKNRLVNKFRVTNTGPDTMYYALGGHPGFYCPLSNGRTRGDYKYVFQEEMTIDRIEVKGNFLQKKVIPFLDNERTLSLDDARVPYGGMFLKEIPSKKIGIAMNGEAPFVTIDLGDFSNVNLWSPPGSPYACIEPMISHHDIQNSPTSIKDKKHMIVLPPTVTNEFEYTIIIGS